MNRMAWLDINELRADRDPWRVYDAQKVEIVVDLIDDTIVSAWVTRVNE